MRILPSGLWLNWLWLNGLRTGGMHRRRGLERLAATGAETRSCFGRSLAAWTFRRDRLVHGFEGGRQAQLTFFSSCSKLSSGMMTPAGGAAADDGAAAPGSVETELLVLPPKFGWAA